MINFRKTIAHLKMQLLELGSLLTISIGVFVLIYLFIAQFLIVSGPSMEPTFIDNDHVIAEKITIKYKPITRGELVILRHPTQNNKLLIKRVIAIPGDVVVIDNGSLQINNQPITEDYLKENGVTESGIYFDKTQNYKVPEGNYLLFGDNRNKSTDSRVWGSIKEDQIIGRIVMIWFPLDRIRLVTKAPI